MKNYIWNNFIIKNYVDYCAGRKISESWFSCLCETKNTTKFTNEKPTIKKTNEIISQLEIEWFLWISHGKKVITNKK